jgi:hypothetical protein
MGLLDESGLSRYSEKPCEQGCDDFPSLPATRRQRRAY